MKPDSVTVDMAGKEDAALPLKPKLDARVPSPRCAHITCNNLCHPRDVMCHFQQLELGDTCAQPTSPEICRLQQLALKSTRRLVVDS
jgi:hypothetical protein